MKIVGSEHTAKHDGYLKRYLETGKSGVIGKKRILPARRKDGTEFDIELAVIEVKTGGEVYFCGYAKIIQNASSARRTDAVEQNGNDPIEASPANSQPVVTATSPAAADAEDHPSDDSSSASSSSSSDDPDTYFNRSFRAGL